MKSKRLKTNAGAKTHHRSKGRMATRALELPLYDSLASMAGQTGIPVAILKQAKKEGCLFVRHARCDLRVFLEWFFNRDGDQDKLWGNELNRYRAAREKIKLQIDEAEVVERGLVVRLAQDLVGNLVGELEGLAQYFPSKLKGMDETKIFSIVKDEIGRVKTNLLSKWKNWEGSHGDNKS